MLFYLRLIVGSKRLKIIVIIVSDPIETPLTLVDDDC